ncbi:MAG: hypothetical protein KDK45_23240, partial [Leptospiraceae bacterium]|nr:hypothetical protein [Leptospiraceae bacterium]
VGVIPHIADLAMKMRFLGSFNYTFATLLKLIRHRPMEFRAIIDGIEERLRSDFISICNSKYTGGAMIMAKDVEVDDGKLYMVSPLMESKLRILKLFPSIFSGKHLEHPRVRHHFIQKMKIQYREPLLLLVDGELEKGENPEISISPGHWNLFMTKKPS